MRNRLFIIRLFCLGAIILSLFAYIVCQRNSSSQRAMMCEVLAEQFNPSEIMLEGMITEIISFIGKEADDYRSPVSDDYVERALQMKQMSNELIEFVQKNITKYSICWLAIQSFHQKMSLLCDNGPALKIYKTDKLVFIGDSTVFRILISKNQVSTDFIQNLVANEIRQCCIEGLNYCSTKVSGTRCGPEIRGLSMTHNPLNPCLQDTVTFEAFLSTWRVFYTEQQIILDGDTLPIKDGVANFRLKYDKPGKYPLHLKATVEPFFLEEPVKTIEKTYWLNIR